MDVIAELGPVFLGSRLRRLAERLQAGAAQVIAGAGLPVQPMHMPLVTALDRHGPMTVGRLAAAIGMSQPGVTRGVAQLAALGLIESRRGAEDRRARQLALTPAGTALMARTKALVWPPVSAVVTELCGTLSGPLLDQIAGLERALAECPLDQRVAARSGGLVIREFTDELAPLFRDINAEWINAMFRLEETDRQVLDDPRARIIDQGGVILFVEAPAQGIVGTCALQKTGEGAYELTKMGVLESARGLKAGEHLLRATIARAATLGADTLYLLTNGKCAAAIHLYEKLGFAHDADIMARYGARYQRCDVAMRYRG